MSHHVIDLKDLHYRYPDGKEAINGVSIHIGHGESIGLVGANGAGKTTLLMLLTGMLFPEGGEVAIGETKVTRATLSIVRQRMGFMFQNPDDQLFMTTVYDDVAFGPRNYKLDEEDVERRVLSSLDTVGIRHLKDRPPYKLSGGEKRAASIASVLSMDPDILIADEPSDALDPRARRRVIDLFKGFSHTKIIASHDLDLILDICERTIILKKGKVIYDGETKKIMGDRSFMEGSGLEIPLSMQGCPICQPKR